MEILSSHRSRHTPARRSAPPRSLARTIARDETNMSTFECTRKLPQHEYALLFVLKHLYIFIEKGKKSFIITFKETTILSVSPKLLLFPTIARHGPLPPPTSYRSVGIGVRNILHFIFFLKLKVFQKLAHGLRTASQLSISEDSAIRIVLTLCRGSTLLSHIHPVTHRVSHVPPYKVYAKLSHRP